MEEALGYFPNIFWTIARNRPIVKAVGAMMDAFWYTDDVDEETRRLVTFVYSHYARSHYSSAHCAFGARERVLERAKISEIFDFDWSPICGERERAILRICRNSARILGEVCDEDISALKAHYGDNTITYIVGLFSMMAFLNKWNELLETTLEEQPANWSDRKLRTIGWR